MKMEVLNHSQEGSEVPLENGDKIVDTSSKYVDGYENKRDKQEDDCIADLPIFHLSQLKAL